MKKKRLIPVLLLKNGFLVQSKGFRRYQNLGNPLTAVKRFSDWAADELIYLDISKNSVYDMRRDDLGHPNRGDVIDIIRDVSLECFMPITIGGMIRTLEHISLRLANGGDKVSINSKALEEPSFITSAANSFGSQCIVVSIDAKIINGAYVVMSEGGRRNTGYDPVKWAKTAEECGAGEILINSIDRDGSRQGYDIELIGNVAEVVSIPVIACGGVGEWSHFMEAFKKTSVDAVAAANIFHYVDQSAYLAKRFLYEHGCNVRPPDLILESER
jgi:cyclase